mmetsp:Transcript_22346/g.48832  ORF Transcript_22346/g.48832 Transcript_22346/m.48832 type:complete len:219 (-) Transcript_22346:937-1593(-)
MVGAGTGAVAWGAGAAGFGGSGTGMLPGASPRWWAASAIMAATPSRNACSTLPCGSSVLVSEAGACAASADSLWRAACSRATLPCACSMASSLSWLSLTPIFFSRCTTTSASPIRAASCVIPDCRASTPSLSATRPALLLFDSMVLKKDSRRCTTLSRSRDASADCVLRASAALAGGLPLVAAGALSLLPLPRAAGCCDSGAADSILLLGAPPLADMI